MKARHSAAAPSKVFPTHPCAPEIRQFTKKEKLQIAPYSLLKTMAKKSAPNKFMKTIELAYFCDKLMKTIEMARFCHPGNIQKRLHPNYADNLEKTRDLPDDVFAYPAECMKRREMDGDVGNCGWRRESSRSRQFPRRWGESRGASAQGFMGRTCQGDFKCQIQDSRSAVGLALAARGHCG